MWGNLKPLRQYGKLITKHYGSAKYDRGLPKEVSCGDTTTTWNGVSPTPRWSRGVEEGCYDLLK
ncbi:unnamed protein product [Durusdinium trenchii]|uniref:Uncharacterized protein n=1 Tax=Durusdinium trenchii TaxID=1381693 RepID=A0ABP0IVL4_9DINO